MFIIHIVVFINTMQDLPSTNVHIIHKAGNSTPPLTFPHNSLHKSFFHNNNIMLTDLQLDNRGGCVRGWASHVLALKVNTHSLVVYTSITNLACYPCF